MLWINIYWFSLLENSAEFIKMCYDNNRTTFIFEELPNNNEMWCISETTTKMSVVGVKLKSRLEKLVTKLFWSKWPWRKKKWGGTIPTISVYQGLKKSKRGIKQNGN